jgi:hypothetical protein
MASGSIADRLLSAKGDVDVLRPYVGNDGQARISRIINGKPKNFMTNAATLTYDEWKDIDRSVMGVARHKLRAFSDLRAANVYKIGNGMASSVLMTQRVTDNGEAQIDMDGLTDNVGDRPHYDQTLTPLPIIHSGFDLPLRQLLQSRASGSRVDTTLAENCTRRVVERVEALTVGTAATFAYGGGTVYGMRTFPDRQTYTITAPTVGGWTPNTLLNELLDARQQLLDAKFDGPFMMYNSPAWNRFLDRDYSQAKGNNTLRQRIQANEGFQDGFKTLWTLPGYEMVIVQMTSDVARALVGMEMTTVQWESPNGLKFHFKVMCILVPQYRCDIEGNCGLMHIAP